MTQGSNSGGGSQGGSGSTDRFDTTDLGGSTASGIGSGASIGGGMSSDAGVGGSMSGMGGTTGSTGSGSTGASDMVGQAVSTAQDTAGQVADQVQDKAGQVMDQARETVTTQVASQKDRAAESLTVLAQAIRQSGDQLRGQEQGAVAGYTDQAAQYVERVSGFLRERDVNEMLYDVERYARRNPAMFIGGAFAVGLLAGRFLKSSSRSSYQSSRGQYPLAPRTPNYGSRSYTYTTGPDYGTSLGTTGGSYGAAGGTSYPSGGASSAGISGGIGSGTAGTGGTLGGATGGMLGETTGSIGGTMGSTAGGGTTGVGHPDTGIGSSEQFSARREDL